MERGDLGLFSDVENDVLNGRSLLWLAWEHPNIVGCAITQIGFTQNSKACVVIACGGEHIKTWIDGLDRIEDYARTEQCDVVRILGRKGWQRILKNYSAPKVVLERRL